MGLFDWLIPGLDTASNIAEHTANTAIDWEYQKKQNAWNAQEAEKARIFNANEALKNRQFQTSEREATQEYNLEMWNLANEYNSPVEQMNRMLAAGINPNAAIQQLSGVSTANPVSSNPQSGSAASGSAASGSFSAAPAGNSNLGSKMLQTQATRAAIEGQKESNEGQRLANERQSIENRFAEANEEVDLSTKKELYKQQQVVVNKLISELDKIKSEVDLNVQEYLFRQVRNPQEIRDADQAFQVMKVQYDLYQQEVENAKKTGSLIEEQTQTENMRQAEIGSQIQRTTQERLNLEETNKHLQYLTNENEFKAWFLDNYGYVPSDDTMKMMLYCIKKDNGAKIWQNFLDKVDEYVYYNNLLSAEEEASYGILKKRPKVSNKHKENQHNFEFRTTPPSMYNPPTRVPF